ncbi:MAG: hypothetical protein RLZZ524_1564 [Pseudomonadota bacterium]
MTATRPPSVGLPRPPVAPDPPSARTVSLVRTLTAPLLAWQAAQLRRNTPRLAEPGVPGVGGAGLGFSRLRLLIVGDSSAAGVGATDPARTLAPLLAEALSRRISETEMGLTRVSWQLVARTGVSSNTALPMMAAQQLDPADVLVTVLGVNDVLEQTPTGRWLANLDAIRSHAKHRAKVRFTVHCAPPRMDLMTFVPQPLRWLMGAQASRLDAALRGHVRHAYRRSRFVLPFDPTTESIDHWLAVDRFHPNEALYARWAEALADHIEYDLTQNPAQGAVLPTGFTPSAWSALQDDDVESGDSRFGALG